jgi:hypothetical protein
MERKWINNENAKNNDSANVAENGRVTETEISNADQGAMRKTVLVGTALSFLVSVLQFFPSTVAAKLEFESSQLMLKNSEQVGKIIQLKIKAAQKLIAKSPEDAENGIQSDPAAIAYLTDAMRIVLSRPDQDGARNSLYSRVRKELSDIGEFEGAMKVLCTEAIDVLKKNDGSAKRQATYITLLEGLMNESRPELDDNADLRKLVENIRDAKISISESVKRQSFIRSMSRLKSPSETAASILPHPKKQPAQ